MKSIAEKRKYVMDYMIDFYDTLDPSGYNTKKFKEEWEGLSDAQFAKRFEEFLNDESQKGFYIGISEYERDLTLDNIFKCSDKKKIPLFEYVALPHINGDLDNIEVTPVPVAVGYIHEKRPQQTALKKNSGSISIASRNQRTGQVIGDDKNATTSNVETYSMVATGSTNGLRELLGPRADNYAAKNEMYAAINRDGFVSLDELSNRQEDKIALNSLDIYFLMQGLRTNLVYPPEVLPNENLA